VVDSRPAEEGAAIRRRRVCGECSYRFTTFERAGAAVLMVRKRDGCRVPFDRGKLVAGMLAACKGRPIPDVAVHEVAAEIEEACRAQRHDLTTELVGRAALERLRGLDKVAYLRFASVYKGFQDAADFAAELRALEGLDGTSAPAL
jgi:transcriptional repressor NrdR